MDIDTAPANHNLRDGTSLFPYEYLSEAIVRASLDVGDKILVAGSRAGKPYAGADGTYIYGVNNPPGREYFPIKVPPGVTVGYWEQQSDMGPGQPPAIALFLQDQNIVGAHIEPCFKVEALTSGEQVKIDFFHTTTAQHEFPYVHPGIEISDFLVGLKMEVLAGGAHGPMDVFIKGALFSGNQKAIEVIGTSGDQMILDVRRSLFFGSGRNQDTQTPAYFIKADLNSATLDLGLTNCDLRSGGAKLVFDGVYGHALGIGAAINLTATSVDFSGQSLYSPGSPVFGFFNSGVFLEIEQGARVDVQLADVDIQDADVHGFWGHLLLPGPGLVRSSGEFTANSNCNFHENGEDGVRLEANEGSVWDLVRFYEAKSHSNGQHGLALLSLAAGEDSGFESVDLQRSLFLNNGFSSSPNGSGVWSSVDGSKMNVYIDRCRFSGNAKSGVNLSQDFTSTYSSSFHASNSLFSLNQGLPSGVMSDAPLRLHYGGTYLDPSGGVLCSLVYNTIVDNTTPGMDAIGFTYDNTAHNATAAWLDGSRIENCVFFDLGGSQRDYAIFPLPDANNSLWVNIAESTRGCWLADPDGLQSPWMTYHAQNSSQANLLEGVDADPLMDTYNQFSVTYGDVFPAAGSILLDHGITPTPDYFSDQIGTQRGLGAGNDIGCFERPQ